MLKLRDYQDKDADWLSTSRRAIYCGEMGVGKTATALSAMKNIVERDPAKIHTFLVVCPVSALSVWEHECQKWFGHMFISHILRTTEDLRVFAVLPAPTTHRLVVAPYSQFSALFDNPQDGKKISRARYVLGKHRWDAIVLDEGHYLASSEAIRTRETLSLVVAADRMWWMTGTPIVNHYGDLYPTCSVLFPKLTTACVGSRKRKDWEARFCEKETEQYGYREVERIVGSKDGAALRNLLDKCSRFRTKEYDLAGELPPISYYPLPVDAPTPDLELFNTPVETWEDDQLLAAILASEDDSISRARRELGMRKVRPCYDWIRDFLDADEIRKLLVFAHHRDVIDQLVDLLGEYRPVKIDGGTSHSKRGDAENLFMHANKDGGSRVLVGQIKACGTALTLTAASTVLFVESSWTPSDNAQAAARVHRIGQQNPVSVYQACAEHSLDERITDILIRKQQEIDVVMQPA